MNLNYIHFQLKSKYILGFSFKFIHDLYHNEMRFHFYSPWEQDFFASFLKDEIIFHLSAF